MMAKPQRLSPTRGIQIVRRGFAPSMPLGAGSIKPERQDQVRCRTDQTPPGSGRHPQSSAQTSTPVDVFVDVTVA